MEILFAIFIGLIVIGVLVWAIRALIGAFGIPQPWATLIYVITVVAAVFALLQIIKRSGGFAL